MENATQSNLIIFYSLMLIEIILKGFVLWFAARNNQRYWFIALLVINTGGILPAIYLLIYKTDLISKLRKKINR